MAAARSILILSVGCNLLLAGWLAARLMRPSAPAASVPAEATPAVASPRVTRTPAVEWVTNQVQAVFPWSRLETNDFRAYAANLRAVGCPEATLRHLLLPDIEKAYDARQREMPGAPPFWATAAQAATQARAWQERRMALEEEKRALMRELTGAESTAKARRVWADDENTLPLVLGFLPDEKAVAVLDGLEQLDHLRKRIRHETRGLLGDEDEAAIRELARSAYQGFLARLTPLEAEELSLRLLDGLQSEDPLGTRRRHRGLELSGAELRQLVQWSGEGKDWVTELLVAQLSERTGSIVERLREERPPDFEPRARALLGEARHAAYVRAHDPAFRQAVRAADRAGLPESVAIQAHDLRQAVLAQARDVAADTTLGEEGRRLAMARIDEAARQSLVTLYGPKAADELARDLQRAAAQAVRKGPR